MRRSTRYFGYLLILAALMTTAKAFIPRVQLAHMEEFHLIAPSFLSWAIRHHLPSMYSFSNEVWYSPVESPWEVAINDEEPDPNTTWHGWYNHHPVRMITFTLNREQFFRSEGDQYLTLKSTYRDLELMTQFRISNIGDILFIDYDY